MKLSVRSAARRGNSTPRCDFASLLEEGENGMDGGSKLLTEAMESE